MRIPPEVEPFVQEINKLIDPMSVQVALDVGSRDAQVALCLKSLFPNATVYAFECNPPAIELCKKNIANCPDIVLVERAVSDVAGMVNFYPIDIKKTITPHADGNIGASSLFLANPEYPNERYYQSIIQVEAITLGSWASENGIDNVDVLWMDLQGAELKALHGLGDLIRNVKVIHTEVEYREMYVGQPLFGEIDKYLKSYNFRLHKKLNTSEWFGDALYVRSVATEKSSASRKADALFRRILSFIR